MQGQEGMSECVTCRGQGGGWQRGHGAAVSAAALGSPRPGRPWGGGDPLDTPLHGPGLSGFTGCGTGMGVSHALCWPQCVIWHDEGVVCARCQTGLSVFMLCTGRLCFLFR